MQLSKPKDLVLVFLVGMLALHAVLFWNSRKIIRAGYPDFTIFYGAGKMVSEGLRHQMYEEQVQYRVQQEFASGVSIRQGALPYNHPPFEALIFAPLGSLPYFAAFLLWDLLGAVILLAIPFLLRPYVPLLRRGPPAFYFLAALAFFPVAMALLQGQDILVSLLLLVLAFISFKNKSDFAGGCWLALGLFRFHLVLPLALMLLWYKRRKAAAGFSVVAFALVLISLAIVGWRGAFAYPHYVLHMEQVMAHLRMELALRMPNLRGLLENFLTPFAPEMLRKILTVLASIAMIIVSAWRWKKVQSVAFDLGFTLCVIATILVSYHALIYDLSLLFLPVLLVVNHVIGTKAIPGRTRAILLAPVFFLFFTPLQMVLALRTGRYGLVSIVLLFWWWAIWREISRQLALLRRDGPA